MTVFSAAVFGHTRMAEAGSCQRTTDSSKVLALVEDANSAGASRDALVQELASRRDADFAAASSAAEKQMIEVAYQDAILSIQNTQLESEEVPLSNITGRARSRLSLRLNRIKSSKPALTE